METASEARCGSSCACCFNQQTVLPRELCARLLSAVLSYLPISFKRLGSLNKSSRKKKVPIPSGLSPPPAIAAPGKPHTPHHLPGFTCCHLAICISFNMLTSTRYVREWLKPVHTIKSRLALIYLSASRGRLRRLPTEMHRYECYFLSKCHLREDPLFEVNLREWFKRWGLGIVKASLSFIDLYPETLCVEVLDFTQPCLFICNCLALN